MAKMQTSCMAEMKAEMAKVQGVVSNMAKLIDSVEQTTLGYEESLEKMRIQLQGDDAVAYFADDDNTYDLRLFHEVSKFQGLI